MIDHVRAWIGADINPPDCKIGLRPVELDELQAVVEKTRHNPLPTLMRKASEFEMSLLPAFMSRVKAMLDSQ